MKICVYPQTCKKNSYNNFAYKTGSNYLNDRRLTTAKTGTLLLGDVIQQ